MTTPPESAAEHEGAIRAIAVFPGGDRFVTGGADKQVKVWDLRTRRLLHVHDKHQDPVLALAATGHSRVVSCSETTTAVWDVGGSPSSTAHRTRLAAAAVKPRDGAVVAIGLNGAILQPPDGATWPRGHRRVDSVAVAAGGKVVTGGSDPIIRTTDWSGNELARLAGRTAEIVATAVSNDGTRIAVGTSNTLRFWDTARRAGAIDLLGCKDTTAVAVAPDGGQVIAGGFNGKIWAWDPNQPAEPIPIPGHDSAVRSLAVTPDCRQLISGTEDGRIGVWDLTTGAPVSTDRSPRSQARIISDQESDVDLLGFAEDVDSIAALISDRKTQPPLAIALLGRWGSGKSSFMRQVRNRVELLAEQGRRNQAHSIFATNVRQVRFNAWNYNDDQLWVGMVERLFAGLAEPKPSNADQAGMERAALRERLRDLEELADPEASSTQRLRARLRLAFADLLRMRRRIVLIATAVGLLGAAAGLAWWQWRNAVVALVLGVLAAAVPTPFISRLVGAWRSVRDLARRQAAGLRQAVHDTRMRLARLDAAQQLALVIEQGGSGGYDQFRGLLGRVHADLRQLSDSARQAFDEWEQAGSAGPPPLERVVLYIDDLDRCSPRKVVDVLAAVHLLLALRLFIVVVAVDPQWLRSCLEHYHSELFGGRGDRVAEVAPLDYLDKIFQVVFTLRPMGKGADRYVEELVPTEDEPALSIEPAATPSTPAGEALSGAAPAGSEPKPDQLPDANPMPQPAGLRLRAEEQRFIQRLNPLQNTPRAVKRVVNVYRLVRAGIADDELDSFIGPAGPYQAVVVLLAVLVATPEPCRVLAERLYAADREAGFVELVEELAAAEQPLQGTHVWTRLLDLLSDGAPVHDNLSTYRVWMGTIARFSFETWDLTKPR